jgi:cellulose synthase/poly-beta-1,6-N-acetylglucosamine synthase-like glycosyltransferase
MANTDPKIRISIGVFAYNEGKDIKKTLDALIDQKLSSNLTISEILVFSDACTDDTDTIVEKMSSLHSTIKLIASRLRRGKSAAINHFLQIAKEKIVISTNGDHIPDELCIDRLVVKLLSDEKIGLVGPQVICVNSGNDLMAYLSKTLWRIHHKVALREAKAGELIAYKKNLVKKLPYPCVLDESTTEAIVQHASYKVAYEPEAKVYVKGPQKFIDEIIQRRRNEVGYILISKQFPNYHPSTFKRGNLLPAIMSEISIHPRTNLFLAVTILSEFLSKILAYWDYYVLKKYYQTWPVAHTTKSLDHEHLPI